MADSRYYYFNFVIDVFQAPIKVFGVEGRYAHALFSAASKSNSLEKVEKELGQVQVISIEFLMLTKEFSSKSTKQGIL